MDDLIRKTIAIILAGGKGERLGLLTLFRSKGAVPFGGKYRLIDFTLSNCVNSGIKQIFVAVQGKDHSLCEHLGEWDRNFSRDVKEFLEIMHPQGEAYTATANAVYENLLPILSAKPQFVLILGGDHIYEMDYKEMLVFQKDKKGELVVAVTEVGDKVVAQESGVLIINENQKIIGFQEKPKDPVAIPGKPGRYLISMGIYLFPIETLVSELVSDNKDIKSSHDFGKKIIPDMIKRGINVFAFQFPGYWRDVGTIDSYFEANMDLISVKPQFDLYKNWLTYGKPRPPAKIVFEESLGNSIFCDGVVVDWGKITRSVISPGVVVRSGAEISEAIIFPDVVIESGVRIRRAIIDKYNIIPVGSVIEAGNMRFEGEQKEKIMITPSGIVIVPRHLNPNEMIGYPELP
jgi:glucose-1-phosphate adenylyltransferase